MFLYDSIQKELNKIKEKKKTHCGMSFEEFKQCMQSLYDVNVDGKRIGDIVEECRDYETEEMNIDREELGQWMSLID